MRHRSPTIDGGAALERALGHVFRDPALLRLALTHRSVSGSRNNERLEFLGDSVLGHVIAEALFSRFGAASEGQLTRARARLVKEETLAAIARGLSLGDHLLLGQGELRSGGFRRDSILADTLEALIGAVHVDAGFEASRAMVLALFSPLLDELRIDDVDKDSKTRLQEWLQGRGLPLPRYEVVETTGDAHAQRFRVQCVAEGLAEPVEAWGTSRRAAEQAVAVRVLGLLTGDTGGE